MITNNFLGKSTQNCLNAISTYSKMKLQGRLTYFLEGSLLTMPKYFNVTGACRSSKHYMVDLASRLEEIKRMSSSAFESERAFVIAFSQEILDNVKNFPTAPAEQLKNLAAESEKPITLQVLFRVLKLWCGQSEKPIVLIIDEVDTATNNQIFLDFLAQLRAAYLDSDATPTFQSVILAGVYDVRNIKRKLRPDEEHKVNSPWNIASDFLVNMSFSADDIAKMLNEYENDYHTGMNIEHISQLLYDYTSGYPYLVSRLCKFLDEGSL